MTNDRNPALANCVCPACGESLDGATSITGPQALPAPGDMAFCLYCETPLVFTGLPGLLTMRRANEAERRELTDLLFERKGRLQ